MPNEAPFNAPTEKLTSPYIFHDTKRNRDIIIRGDLVKNPDGTISGAKIIHCKDENGHNKTYAGENMQILASGVIKKGKQGKLIYKKIKTENGYIELEGENLKYDKEKKQWSGIDSAVVRDEKQGKKITLHGKLKLNPDTSIQGANRIIYEAGFTEHQEYASLYNNFDMGISATGEIQTGTNGELSDTRIKTEAGYIELWGNPRYDEKNKVWRGIQIATICNEKGEGEKIYENEEANIKVLDSGKIKKGKEGKLTYKKIKTENGYVALYGEHLKYDKEKKQWSGIRFTSFVNNEGRVFETHEGKDMVFSGQGIYQPQNGDEHKMIKRIPTQNGYAILTGNNIFQDEQGIWHGVQSAAIYNNDNIIVEQHKGKDMVFSGKGIYQPQNGDEHQLIYKHIATQNGYTILKGDNIFQDEQGVWHGVQLAETYNNQHILLEKHQAKDMAFSGQGIYQPQNGDECKLTYKRIPTQNGYMGIEGENLIEDEQGWHGVKKIAYRATTGFKDYALNNASLQIQGENGFAENVSIQEGDKTTDLDLNKEVSSNTLDSALIQFEENGKIKRMPLKDFMQQYPEKGTVPPGVYSHLAPIFDSMRQIYQANQNGEIFGAFPEFEPDKPLTIDCTGKNKGDFWEKDSGQYYNQDNTLYLRAPENSNAESIENLSNTIVHELTHATQDYYLDRREESPLNPQQLGVSILLTEADAQYNSNMHYAGIDFGDIYAEELKKSGGNQEQAHQNFMQRLLDPNTKEEKIAWWQNNYLDSMGVSLTPEEKKEITTNAYNIIASQKDIDFLNILGAYMNNPEGEIKKAATKAPNLPKIESPETENIPPIAPLNPSHKELE